MGGCCSKCDKYLVGDPKLAKTGDTPKLERVSPRTNFNPLEKAGNGNGAPPPPPPTSTTTATAATKTGNGAVRHQPDPVVAADRNGTEKQNGVDHEKEKISEGNEKTSLEQNTIKSNGNHRISFETEEKKAPDTADGKKLEQTEPSDPVSEATKVEAVEEDVKSQGNHTAIEETVVLCSSTPSASLSEGQSSSPSETVKVEQSVTSTVTSSMVTSCSSFAGEPDKEAVAPKSSNKVSFELEESQEERRTVQSNQSHASIKSVQQTSSKEDQVIMQSHPSATSIGAFDTPVMASESGKIETENVSTSCSTVEASHVVESSSSEVSSTLVSSNVETSSDVMESSSSSQSTKISQSSTVKQSSFVQSESTRGLMSSSQLIESSNAAVESASHTQLSQESNAVSISKTEQSCTVTQMSSVEASTEAAIESSVTSTTEQSVVSESSIEQTSSSSSSKVESATTIEQQSAMISADLLEQRSSTNLDHHSEDLKIVKAVVTHSAETSSEQVSSCIKTTCVGDSDEPVAIEVERTKSEQSSKAATQVEQVNGITVSSEESAEVSNHQNAITLHLKNDQVNESSAVLSESAGISVKDGVLLSSHQRSSYTENADNLLTTTNEIPPDEDLPPPPSPPACDDDSLPPPPPASLLDELPPPVSLSPECPGPPDPRSSYVALVSPAGFVSPTREENNANRLSFANSLLSSHDEN